MENRWGEQPECAEALAEAAADWLLAHPTQSFEDCARHFQVASWMLAEAWYKRLEAISEAAADWLLAHPTQSFEECARHFKVAPKDLDYAFSDNETIRNRFDAVAPDPPPPCPHCGGKTVRIVYGFPRCPDYYFSYAGPKLYAYLAARTENHGCIRGPEKFRCRQCGHRWPTDFFSDVRDLFG